MDKNIFSGVVVRVVDLDACRAFYRDIVDLGEPCLDSNFRVEFRLGGLLSLCLEKVDAGQRMQAPNDRVMWYLQVPKLSDFRKRMDKCGYRGEVEACDRFGWQVLRYKDPEGNCFLVTEMSPRPL